MQLLPCELFNICVLWCCHILTDKDYGRPKGQKDCKKCLSGACGGSRFSGDEGRCGSGKERIHTGQVTGKEQSTSVRVMYV